MLSYAPVRSRELELMILLGLFQLKIVYDSMNPVNIYLEAEAKKGFLKVVFI